MQHKVILSLLVGCLASVVNPVLAWSLPLAQTCCVNNGSGESIASPVCRAVCYVHRMALDRPNVSIKALRNFEIACRDDFRAIMIGAIHHAGVKGFKIHVAGEFFSVAYIDSWSEIVSKCPDISFFTYTRAWRRLAWHRKAEESADQGDRLRRCAKEVVRGRPQSSFGVNEDGEETSLQIEVAASGL